MINSIAEAPVADQRVEMTPEEIAETEKKFEVLIDKTYKNLMAMAQETQAETSKSTKQMLLDGRGREKMAVTIRRMAEEMVVAAYCNRNNPNWDCTRPETYWTEIPADDPLSAFFN